MKIIKTATIFILILILISVAIYFLPTEKILEKLPFINTIYNNTSITINSKNGKATIKINGKDYGETPITVDNISEGDVVIEITRVSVNQDFYKPKTISFFLERGTEAIIDYEIGPDNINSGYILYYTKSSTSSKNTGFLSINSDPEESNIYLDDEYFSKTPISASSLNAKNYQLKIKALGYEDLSFPIIVRNGYNLNINVSLYPIPTLIENEQ